ncbi:hypothetical protein FQN49_006507 [Arthroderma sp. PD_2]|nr:hypothetical protein FQN49_006507 [Arthroderma sp. PD_2]
MAEDGTGLDPALDQAMGKTEQEVLKPSHSEQIDEGAHEKPKYVSGVKLAFILTALALVMFLSILDISIVATAIPRITSYQIVYLELFMLILMTSQYAFLAFLAVFEFGSLLCGVAVSSNMLIIGRAIAGFGSSGLSNGALVVLSSCIPMHSMAAYLGALLSSFYINLPIGGVAAVLLLLIDMPGRKTISAHKQPLLQKLQQLDLVGFTLFAPAAVQLLLALDWGGTEHAWGSATIIGLICGAVGTAAIFCGWQYYMGDSAMIPFSIIGRRIVWCSCLLGGFFMGAMLLVSFYLPLYFQAVRGVSPTLSGVYLLPQVISQIIFSTVSGVLVKKFGYYLPWSVGASILEAISAGLISTFTPTTSTGMWIGYQILAGAGRGCGLQMPIIAVQNAVTAEQQSVAFAIVMATQTFGGSVLLSVGKAIFSNGLETALPTYAPGVNPLTIINAGAGDVKDVVSQQFLPGVLLAYNKAISQVFYAATGAACATFLLSWGIGWKSVKNPGP